MTKCSSQTPGAQNDAFKFNKKNPKTLNIMSLFIPEIQDNFPESLLKTNLLFMSS